MTRFPNNNFNQPDSKAINVLARVKNHEKYIFLYDDASRVEALRTLGRFAGNEDLSFTWYDAAILSQEIRKRAKMYDDNNDQTPNEHPDSPNLDSF